MAVAGCSIDSTHTGGARCTTRLPRLRRRYRQWLIDRGRSHALRTHGIGFVDAQALRHHLDRLELPARSIDEPQVQVIGRIGTRIWSAFSTMRAGRVRIISVRRARDEKEQAYRQEPLSAARLDALHDAGADMSAHMDLSKGTRPERAVQRVNVDFPVDLLREIDQEAAEWGHEAGLHQGPPR